MVAIAEKRTRHSHVVLYVFAIFKDCIRFLRPHQTCMLISKFECDGIFSKYVFLPMYVFLRLSSETHAHREMN
jgi:hypothetical protein